MCKIHLDNYKTMPVLMIRLAVLTEFSQMQKILQQELTMVTCQIMLVWIIRYAGVSEKVEMCKKIAIKSIKLSCDASKIVDKTK